MNLSPLKFIAIPALMALAACGTEPPAEQAPSEAAATAEPEAPAIPPPDQTVFAATFAETCPDAEPISTSVCKRAGMGSPEVICEYGLGDDEYLRNETILVEGETQWEIVDPETTCAQGA